MKKHLFLFTLLVFYFGKNIFAQNYSQSITGKVIDQQSQVPLSGVLVELIDSTKVVINELTNEKGFYLFKSVKTGRITLKFSKAGYEDYLAENIIHISGKQTLLDIEMVEKVAVIKSVSVKAKKENNNQNITLSSRGFDIEETRRYAGSRNDPARMASNFAGVIGNNDSRNDIIVRGNSPQGLLWRVEGIDIPNPNHFGAMGASGGPVSILNNNVLAKSDFLISAFPAMYGNAVAGVFDLQLRNGNKNKTEYTGQVGFNGFELGVEGPISKKNKSSYLINYRLSNLYVLSQLGFNFGTGAAIPNYQDVSFKFDFPYKKDKITLWGIGGTSNVHFTSESSDDTTNFYSNNSTDLKYRTNMGVIGINHTHFFSPKVYLKTSVGSNYTSVKTKVDSIWNGGSVLDYNDNSNQIKHIVNFHFNYKKNTRLNLSLGTNFQNIRFNFNDSVRNNNKYIKLRDEKGQTNLFQSYILAQFKANEYLTLNLGLHQQMLFLNNSNAIEPRFGINYQVKPKLRFSLATGLHSQMQSMQTYYLKTKIGNDENLTNKNLDFTKSFHNVLAIDYKFNRKWKAKSEVYYQYLYKIPVTLYPSYYSAINEGTDFNVPNTDSLMSQGIARNKGLEFTFERLFDKGLYLLNTISIFSSEYQGSNKIWKNTAYNSNYVYNLLVGKELILNKKNTLAFDIKLVTSGGRRYTPIDLEASNLNKRQINIVEKSFDEQFKSYFRFDFKITYRRSGKKITQEWFADIQNITNQKNVFIQQYSAKEGRVITQYQLGFFPNINYRINF